MRSSLRQVLFRSAATGLDLNFAGGVFSLNNTSTASVAAIPGWTFSRTDTNGTATALDLAGNVIQFATGVPRITNRGILVEEARTNSIRNSVAAGAVAGTPGTLPTNWVVAFNNGGIGMTQQVVGSGTEDGLTYIDLRFYGTPANSNDAANIYPDGSSFTTAAVSGQVWTSSIYARLISGTIAGGSLRVQENGGAAPITSSTVTATSTRTRFATSRTLTDAATTSVRTFLRLDWTQSVATDFTVRLYGPQFEVGAFATSPIITTGAAGTRGAENAFVAGLAGLPPFTFFTEGDAGASGFPQYGAIDDGTSANRVSHLRINSSNSAYAEIQSGGSTGANVGPTGAVFAGQTTKIASSVTSAGLRASRDGSAIATAARTVNALNRLCVGNATGSLPANGYIRRIRVLPTAASDAQLQALTAP